MEEIIISFYKEPKTELNINNTFRNLLKAGHEVTLKQVAEVIKNLDEYHKVKTYKEQKNLCLKTVTSNMTSSNRRIYDQTYDSNKISSSYQY